MGKYKKRIEKTLNGRWQRNGEEFYTEMYVRRSIGYLVLRITYTADKKYALAVRKREVIAIEKMFDDESEVVAYAEEYLREYDLQDKLAKARELLTDYDTGKILLFPNAQRKDG